MAHRLPLEGNRMTKRFGRSTGTRGLAEYISAFWLRRSILEEEGLRSAVARDEELRQSRPDLWQSMEATRRAKTGRPLRRTGDSERWGSSHCAFGCLSHSVGRNCSVSNGETPPQLRLSSRNRVAVPARPESAQNRYVYRTFDARRLSSVEKRSRRGSSCQLCV